MIRIVRTTFVACAVMAAGSADAQSLVISRAGSRPIEPAPSRTFSGAAQIEMLFDAADPSHSSGGVVTFEAGARTAWHVHPGGQILIITAGVGRVQRWGDPVEEVRVGDVVRIPAGQKHWHGASPDTAMTHLAITERHDGATVQWMEPVTDAQYGSATTAGTPAPAQAAVTNRPSGPLQQKLAPGLAALTDEVLYGDVWKRGELSPRDRSLVTITALIALGKTGPLAGHLGRALDNGLQPSEASALLAHLAIYCGWPDAVSALEAYDQVYRARNIDTAALATTSAHLAAMPSDATRAKALTDDITAVAPKFAQLTKDVVFDDLWRRPDLTPRDRSLVTIVALAATGADDVKTYLQRGIESGLTRAQIAEAVTHVAFYAGWGKATKALREVARSPER